MFKSKNGNLCTTCRGKKIHWICDDCVHAIDEDKIHDLPSEENKKYLKNDIELHSMSIVELLDYCQVIEKYVCLDCEAYFLDIKGRKSKNKNKICTQFCPFGNQLIKVGQVYEGRYSEKRKNLNAMDKTRREVLERNNKLLERGQIG